MALPPVLIKVAKVAITEPKLTFKVIKMALSAIVIFAVISFSIPIMIAAIIPAPFLSQHKDQKTMIEDCINAANQKYEVSLDFNYVVSVLSDIKKNNYKDLTKSEIDKVIGYFVYQSGTKTVTVQKRKVDKDGNVDYETETYEKPVYSVKDIITVAQELEKQKIAKENEIMGFVKMSQKVVIQTDSQLPNFQERNVNMNVSPDEYKGISNYRDYLTGNYEGVNENFLQRLGALAKGLNTKIEVTSGYRSIEYQKQICEETLREKAILGYYRGANGGIYNSQGQCMVAAPGGSMHNYRLAVDVAYPATTISDSTLKKFGIYRPMDYENWHFQPMQ
jgi:hypothetical protein